MTPEMTLQLVDVNGLKGSSALCPTDLKSGNEDFNAL